MAGRAGARRRLAQADGVYVNINQTADDLRAGTTPDTGWAGFNYDTGMPRENLKELLLHCAENDIRAVTIAFVNLACLICSTKWIAFFRSRDGVG